MASPGRRLFRRSSTAPSDRPGPTGRGASRASRDGRGSADRPKQTPRQRATALRDVWKMTRARDPKLPVYVLPPALLVAAIFIAVGWALGLFWGIVLTIFGILLGVLLGMGLFYRRASGAAIREIEGQPGAAAGILSSMRGDWQVTPAVGFNANQDLVHRVVGRPGVVLVGEGDPQRVRALIAQERRRVTRVAEGVPIHELVVGDDGDAVPLRKLQSKVMKLPKTLRPVQASELKKRLRALGGGQPPLPKGPMPRPGQKLPRGRIR